jgi:hypothetical protein
MDTQTADWNYNTETPAKHTFGAVLTIFLQKIRGPEAGALRLIVTPGLQ